MAAMTGRQRRLMDEQISRISRPRGQVIVLGWQQWPVRNHAITQIVWHGRDAEALQMEQAREYLNEGQHNAVEIKMRIVWEIRRQMELNEPELMAS